MYRSHRSLLWRPAAGCALLCTIGHDLGGRHATAAAVRHTLRRANTLITHAPSHPSPYTPVPSSFTCHRFLTSLPLSSTSGSTSDSVEKIRTESPTNHPHSGSSTTIVETEQDNDTPTSTTTFTYAPRDLDLAIPLPHLKYPIVLVHGYLGYASLIRSPVNQRPLLEYFGSVRQHLIESSDGGITVLTPVNPPAASIVARAKKLQVALGIKTQGLVVQEKKLQGTEDTIRKVETKDNTTQTNTTLQSPSNPSSPLPIEFANTGGHFDASSPENHTSSSTTDLHASIIIGGRNISLNDYDGKFHLVAHSMGGLDSRYLISQLQHHHPSSNSNDSHTDTYTNNTNSDAPPHTDASSNRICSLTTISSPHRGSPIADMVLDVLDVPFSLKPDPDSLATAPTLNKFSQWIGGLFGIDVSGINNLSTSSMRDFNSRVRDHPDVRYLSYGGSRRFPWYSVWSLPSSWIESFGERHDHTFDVPDGICPGGENDGMVSVGSSKWGTYCGTTNLDHLEQIGLGVWNKHIPLYRQIVFRLHELEQAEEDAKRMKEKKSEEVTKSPLDEPMWDL